MRSRWLASGIAWRYLLSKKKHGAVGVITWISVVGVVVATAATICVLSVFNGFQGLLSSKLELLSPDVEITPRTGRTFEASPQLMARLDSIPGVTDVCPVVEDRALGVYKGQEMPVRIKGVDTTIFLQNSALKNLLVSGTATFQPVGIENAESTTRPDEFSEEAILAEELGEEQRPQAVVSAGVALRLNIPSTDTEVLTLISPRREGMVNMANPSASLQMTDVGVEGVYQAMQTDLDKDYVILDLNRTRELLDIQEPAVTSLAVYAQTEPQQLAAKIQSTIPDSLMVRDRMQQHESQFRMSNIEKWITFLLLAFILLIASFNLISSLAMLVIDKQENLSILHALGATRRQIGRIFAWESALVTLLGGVIGIVAGSLLSLLQQHFGLIKLGGDPATLVTNTYPAQLQLTDLVIVAIPLIIIGLLTATLTARFARSRLYH